MKDAAYFLKKMEEKKNFVSQELTGYRLSLSQVEVNRDRIILMKILKLGCWLTNNLNVMCRRDCVSTYTSKSHIKRHLNKLSALKGSEEPSAVKRLGRSGATSFNFRQHCLFSGEESLAIDPKHPDRWHRVVHCRTADRGQ